MLGTSKLTKIKTGSIPLLMRSSYVCVLCTVYLLWFRFYNNVTYALYARLKHLIIQSPSFLWLTTHNVKNQWEISQLVKFYVYVGDIHTYKIKILLKKVNQCFCLRSVRGADIVTLVH